MSMHPDELHVPVQVARQLVRRQFPEWSALPIRQVRASGTVNAIFRLGDGMAARFPLREADPADVRQLLEREAEASAAFAGHSPFPSPTPVAIGDPGDRYPLPWSVQTWLPGTVARPGDGGGDDLARDLAALVGTLRGVDTGGVRFEGGGRGGDLSDHDSWLETCLHRSEGLLEVPRLAALWGYFRELPRSSSDVMTHGDLIPGNVLVAEGRLAGVLDCGGFGPADPALDVIAGWHLLDDGPRAVFRAELGSDDLEWERSKAWAFQQAMGAVWYYATTNPMMNAMGRRTLRRIVAHTPA